MILAAMGAAALASPVAAQTSRNTNAPVSENNALWGVENAPPHEHTYGSAAHPQTQTSRFAPDAAAVSQPRVIDCVHVPFPQCSGS
jgi:hypothetical protein